MLKHMQWLMAFVIMAAVSNTAVSKTVGLWKDARSYITDGMLKTFQEDGWQTIILQGKDLSDEAKLAGLDVVVLPGGHNQYFFADFHARRALVKFAAGGKGVLAGAVRGGYVRTGNHPLFPPVGEVYNRVNGPYLSAFGDSELAQAIDQPFCSGGSWDHMVVKVGPWGKVFAVHGEDPVGVYGDWYGGRVIVFGSFLGAGTASNAVQGTERQVMLKSVNWLAGAPQKGESERVKFQAQADLDFLRRETMWDWTLNERGPGRGPGALPQLRNHAALALESRLFTLEYMSRFLTGKPLDSCQATSGELRQALKTLDDNYLKQTKAVTAKINALSYEELLAENPFANPSNVVRLIEAAPNKTAEERADMKSGLSDMAAGRTLALFLHGAEYAEKLLPADRQQKMIALADQTLAGVRPAFTAAKAVKLTAAHMQDMAAVSGLIEKAGSADVLVRRAAVLELGRIGGPKSESVLLKTMKDSDDKVRVSAIQGLGWMQARPAVPALMETLGGKDIVARRRAAQALGQIGDDRAVKALINVLADPDCDVAVNAALSLGWLKAKQAVPELLKILASLDRQNADQRALMLAAIRALGHIGDPSALPVLEKLVAEAKDAPILKRIGRVKNVYSTSKSLGLQGHAELAVEEINAGGRSEIGVKQADFLGSKEVFYRLAKNFNAFVGRPSQGDPPGIYWPYVREAGMTGIHNAWGDPGGDPDKYQQALAVASELDLCWLDALPTDYNSDNVVASRANGIEKPAGDLVLLKFQDESAFQGFWFEETYPSPPYTEAQFEAWLAARYGADWRKTLGLKPEETKFENSHTLTVEFLNYCSELQQAAWRETQDWLHGLRKGCSFTYTISEAEPTTWPGLAAVAGTVIDSIGPETYQCFGRFNSYFMEMHKNGEARPILAEFYNWYTPSAAHEIRGFAQHLMHGECFYNFHMPHIFAQANPGDNMWSWDATRWDSAKKIFQKAQNIRDYIAVPDSAANVGLVISDLSNLAVDSWNYGGGLGKRWPQNRCALWTALNQSQIPTDVIWAESLTPEKLGHYKVLVLADARIVTPAQAQLLRDWTAGGGTLIVCGAASRFDIWARPLPDYALADVLGVQFAEFAGVSDPDKIDTFCWIQGKTTATKVASDAYRTGTGNYYVHRDIKPVKSIGLYKTTAQASPLLPGISPDTACEYDMPLGYDKVKPAAAGTLAVFANNDPALTVNKVGQGLCYFWTPAFPALSYISSQWEMHNNGFDFWPNVRELLEAMVKGGLAHTQATLPVDVTNVSKEVEVTLRQQPEKNRMMVHLLDYDPKSSGVKGAVLLVHPPAGRTVKRIFYPDTDTLVKTIPGEGGVTAKLRDFDVHDMAVVEWENRE